MSNVIAIEISVDEHGKATAAFKNLERDIDKLGGKVGEAGRTGGSAMSTLTGGATTALGAVTGLSLGVAGVTLALVSAGRAAYDFGEQSVQAFREAEPAQRALINTARSYNGELIQSLNSAEALREVLGSTRAEAQSVLAISQRVTNIAGLRGEGEAARLAEAVANLAAGQGRSTSEVPTILEQILSGQDEGLNRLGRPNPSKIYEEYAASIGKVTSALTQQEQVRAIVLDLERESERSAGALAERLESAAGKLDLVNNRWADFKAEVGRAITENDTFNDGLTATIELLKQIAPPKLTVGDDPAAIALERADNAFGRIRAAAESFGGAAGPSNALLSLFGLSPTNDSVFEKELANAQRLLELARKSDAEAKRIQAERDKDAEARDAREAREAEIKKRRRDFENLLRGNPDVASLRLARRELDNFSPEDERKFSEQIEQAIRKRVEALIKPLQELRSETDKLFDEMTARASARNPFVRFFSDAEESVRSFSRQSQELTQRYGEMADGVIGKLRQLAEARRDAIASDALGQRFEDQLSALELRQRARGLREGDPGDFDKSLEESGLTRRDVLANMLGEIEGGRLRISPTDAARAVFADSEDASARNAREALDRIQEIRDDALSRGLGEEEAQRLADKFTLDATGRLGDKVIRDNPDLLDETAGALERQANRVAGREEEARARFDQDLRAREQLSEELNRLTQAVRANAEKLDRGEFTVRFVNDSGLSFDVQEILGGAARPEPGGFVPGRRTVGDDF